MGLPWLGCDRLWASLGPPLANMYIRVQKFESMGGKCDENSTTLLKTQLSLNLKYKEETTEIIIASHRVEILKRNRQQCVDIEIDYDYMYIISYKNIAQHLLTNI